MSDSKTPKPIPKIPSPSKPLTKTHEHRNIPPQPSVPPMPKTKPPAKP